MKLLKNLGWFLLAILSFFIHLWLHSGARDYVACLRCFTLCCYPTLCRPWLEFMCTAFTNGIRKVLFVLRRVASTDLFGSLLGLVLISGCPVFLAK